MQAYKRHGKAAASAIGGCCKLCVRVADKRQREEKRQREREEAELVWEQGRTTWQQRLLEDVRLEVSLHPDSAMVKQILTIQVCSADGSSLGPVDHIMY